MTLRRIAGPTDLPVSVDEARSHLRVDDSLDDAAIEAMIRAALAHAEKWTGQPFESQTWEQVLDAFPAAAIDLELGPVLSVTSVAYDDEDGAEQTVDAENFVLDTASRCGRVVPSAGFEWPATLDAINAVRVRFVVGAGAPEDVRHSILLLIAHWYANREAASEKPMTDVPFGASALLSLHRRMFA